MKALGIDFGLTRIGIAYSQGDIAEGVGTFTVPTKKQKIALIRRLVLEYNADTIVLGKTASTINNNRESF